jgi:hypothetical protein
MFISSGMKNCSIPIVFKRRKDVLEGRARKAAVFAGRKVV